MFAHNQFALIVSLCRCRLLVVGRPYRWMPGKAGKHGGGKLTLFFVVLNKHQKEYAIMKPRCKCCGSVYTHETVGNDFCTINCFKFYHNDGNVESAIHQIISKLTDYNDADAELDTMDKVFTYKEHKALVD